MKATLLGLLVVAHVAAPSRPLDAQPAAARVPDGVGTLIRQLADSLRGGGVRAGMVLVAADSASATLLRLSGVQVAAAPGSAPLVCPSSTGADGRPVPPPVGYVVQVQLAPDADTAALQLRIAKRCEFRFRGRPRGFAQGGLWTLRRDGGRWHIAATLDEWIT